MKKLVSYAMNIKKWAAVCMCAVAVASCTQKETGEDEGILFPEVTLGNFVDSKTSLKSILDDYNVIALETTDESLIGGSPMGIQSNKVIKSNGKFFIQSINDIVVFDNDGRFIGRLSKVGAGPEEYEVIMDFDIVPEYNEIWVSSYHKMLRYDIDSFDYKSSIPLDFYANKIKHLGNGTFISKTSGDKMFNICSEKGEVLDSYLDQEWALSGEATVQFIDVKGGVASILDGSNSAVCYDPGSKEFYMSDILHNANHKITTIEDCREYCERYGDMEFSRKLMDNFIRIISFRQQGDQGIMSLGYPNNDLSFIINNGKEAKEYIVRPEEKCIIEDDIFGKEDVSFLLSYFDCISDDSFLFIVESDDPDPNPSILEVKKFK